uniref:LRR-RLK n=1 Tax=Rhizophora mucronata TaxID=61149 RepID=A0A2P2K8G6_RHIMU
MEEVSNSKETNSNPYDSPESPRSPKSSVTAAKSAAATTSGIHSSSVKKSNACSTSNNNNNINVEDELILDISEKRLEIDLLGKADGGAEELYLYKNAFSLVPSSVGRLGRLRTLKFFGNEVNLFPAEFENLVGLECLQVKVSSLGLNGLNFSKLKNLKELELSKVPPRPSVLTIFSEITALKCLTRLSVCHFSVRYVPPEIGCLKSLEYLDLSFNKIKSLPSEIGYLDALISLKVANNKLVELPSCLSSLQKLENLDLSNNRLTSLGSLEFSLMHGLKFLNLQYNKLLSCCQIPPWICFSLEGNAKDFSNGDFISSSVEMDVYETPIQEDDGKFSCTGSNHSASSLLIGSSSSSRCFAARRSCKRWKRRHYLQERARQEHFSSRTKRKGEVRAELLALKETDNSKLDNLDVSPETDAECASDIIGFEGHDDKEVLPGEVEGESLHISFEGEKISSEKGFQSESCSCNIESKSNGREVKCYVPDQSSTSIGNGAIKEDKVSSSEVAKITCKSKRHSDRDLDNPKPCKYRRPLEDSSNTSCKYSNLSFCSIEDRLPDGFYDAGRDRPFLPLSIYEQILDLDSREVILLDREKDEELNATTLSAQLLISRLKRLNCSKGRSKVIDDLQIASLLALFVSDHFGGSDKSASIERTRKAVSGSNYQKPFVCTCSTGNSDSIAKLTKQILDTTEDIVLSDLCEKSLRSIKARRSSVVVPLGSLQFGVCRHRALLMKYLCDRMEPPVPCELVRGYLDFLPHAWNIILIKKGGSLVRMVVDACFPLDIREETDPEYFCRYIPLSRTNIPLSSKGIVGPSCSFPSFSTCDEIEKAVSSTVIQCKLGTVEAAAKVHTLEVCGASMDNIRKFEYKCLGEVRILSALQHPCIVEMYGHQISSKWISAEDEIADHRILQSAIFLEHVKGGSLKSYLEKVAETGDKHVSLDLALWIARDVACALAELHSKHIIHRDIKSENVLIDLDSKRADGMPVVKLCDFDHAVPLRSFLHTCCISHRGIPPPDLCVGTPRWMAPEVLQAMHKSNLYGLV